MLKRPLSCLLGSDWSRRALSVRATFSIVSISLAFSFVAALSVSHSSFATEIPDELANIGIKEHPGTTVSASELHFKDESGKDVQLASFFKPGKPVILAMVYYECPNLCNMLLNGLSDSLKTLDWTPGTQFDIVAVSINPKETPDLAAKKKAAYIKAYGRPASVSGWHFLTGEESQIKRLASEVGFGYRYDEQEKQYAHAAVLTVLTPEAKISRYLYGIEFREQDLRLSLVEASDGKVGSIVDRLLLFCYHYNPQERKYSPVVSKIMETGAAGTVLVFGGFLAVLSRRDRRRSLEAAHSSSETKGSLEFMFFTEAHADILPIAATEAAVSWDSLYNFLVWLSIFFFVLVVGAMILFVIQGRKRPGHKSVYETGSHLLEAIWVGVPTVLLLIIFGWGYHVYRDMKQAPSDAYEIKVVGKQWLWNFMYDNGTTTTGELYVPVNKPVKLLMTSQDVLHGFFIPNFRVKQDVVPGMYSSVWFEATIPGKHQVFCTEYCGTSHSGMLAQVIALNEKDWNDWLRGKKLAVDKIPTATADGNEAAADNASSDKIQTVSAAPSEAATGNAKLEKVSPPVSMIDQGKGLYNKLACATCHSTDGSAKVGPTFKGLFGSKVTLNDGSTVTADENYIRESIEEPNAKIVKGYAPQMPTFKGLVNEQDMNSLISFIKAQK